MDRGDYYPWQAAERKRLVQQREADKMPHALLLSGARHLGKRDFALCMAGYLLCGTPVAGDPCGTCANCHLVAAGTHPDLRLIEPEGSKLIKIEQIRELTDWVNQTAQRGGFKVALIHPAEQMNLNAANALLKSLEEPSAGTVIILVSDLPGRLPPTIRSRCQHVAFAVPSWQEGIAWLEVRGIPPERGELLLRLAGGAPLAVLRVFDEPYLKRRIEIATCLDRLIQGTNPLELARMFVRADAEADLRVIHGIIADALRLRLTGTTESVRNRDLVPLLRSLDRAMEGRGLYAVLDAVTTDRRAAVSASNPNIGLLFEALLIEMRGYCSL